MPESDLKQFAENDFDVKKWVNASLSADDRDDAIDQQASDLVLQLQMWYHELAQSLDNDCKQTIQNVPRALIDVETLRYDTLALWEKLDAAREDIEKVEETTGQSILTLSEVDTVKQRMVSTNNALSMAQKWTQLLQQLNAMADTIENLSIAPGLATEELQAAPNSEENSTNTAQDTSTASQGDTLQTTKTSGASYRDGILEYHALVSELRACLAYLKKVSDYAERKSVLNGYEMKLEKAIRPRLVDALTAHSLADTRTYQKLLEGKAETDTNSSDAPATGGEISREAGPPAKSLVSTVFVESASSAILKDWQPTASSLTTGSGMSPSASPRAQQHLRVNSPRQMALEGSPVNQAQAYVDDITALYGLILTYLTTEKPWVDSLFGANGMAQTVQCELVGQVLSTSKPSVTTALNAISSAAAPAPSKSQKPPARDVLPSLVAAHSATQDFIDFIDPILIRRKGEDTHEPRKRMMHLAFSPFCPHQRRFGTLVEIYMTRLVEKLLRFPQVGYLDTVRRVAESVPLLFGVVESGRDACFQFTYGLGYKALCQAVDNIMEAYFYKMNVLLTSLRSKCNLDSTANSNVTNSADSATPKSTDSETDYLPYGQQDWSHFQGALMLLQACGDMIHRCHKLKSVIMSQSLPFAVSIFEDELEQHNNRSHRTPTPDSTLDSAECEEFDLTAPYNYLAGNPTQFNAALADSKAILQYYRSTHTTGGSPTDGAKHNLLASTEKLVNGFNDAVHTLAFDIIFVHVERMLAAVPNLTSWTSKPNKSGAGFSLMQQNYITHVGQHMLTLPQQLELFNECVDDVTANENLTAALVSGSLPKYYTSPVEVVKDTEMADLNTDANAEETDDNIYAHKWLEAVAQATMKRYCDRILQIGSLSNSGCLQLSKDIEYLTNVLNVLDVDVTVELAHIKAVMDAPEAERNALIGSYAEYESVRNINELIRDILNSNNK
ncbi:hypothetical protein SARC_06344 [Sphaeroforma arctica JP610]|uniref:Conserved oligomeric Golgi complex subunit 7 n=1 Tax=Sphaeroforma arctica JP610 TaxID=667725 RepID=A0A0L0FWV5_9EUKA|nr:hypothetical protein, variant [Sphaeroforma arctica JP610]XP_014155228.1 hypothetical protein SARC_06344 [Sphaeroforma arctica JP610]KNC81325.1 hypothetical protein, variant [Sphaeroforma arctica JP610]KNC81326.1 hypothetical protein SARC_06344 [Sphaeroforma arctica JP610]|eukprot:XP_014155227.1 hypothetical protein, variant [Sphaeroforma arctica JP610]